MRISINLIRSISLALIAFTFACNEKQGAEAQSIKSDGSNKIAIGNAKADVQLDKLKLPTNFKIDVWAADIPNARSMAISDDGIVFVGNRQEKNVYAVVDENKDGKSRF